jgi:hypothetical protein
MNKREVGSSPGKIELRSAGESMLPSDNVSMVQLLIYGTNLPVQLRVG